MLAALSAVLLVAGVIAAVVVEPDAGSVREEGVAASGSDEVDGDTPDISEETTRTTTAAGADAAASTTTTTAGAQLASLPPPKEIAAAVDPPATKPPVAGEYRYRATIDGETREVTTRVEDRGSDGAVVKQLITIETQEGSVANDFEWRSDGGYVTRSKLTFGSVQVDCDWNPDAIQVRLPLRRNLEWSGESSCTTTVFGQPATLKLSGQAKVVDAKRVQVAAGTFDVWVVEGRQTLTFTSPSFTVTQEQSGTTWFAPGIGINVRDSGTAKTSGPEGGRDQQVESELVSRPA